MAIPGWFDKVPAPGEKAGFQQKAMHKAHVWGRQKFASSYARGGMAATMFAPSRTEMMTSPWKKYSPGTDKHVQRLRELDKLHPNTPGIKKALKGVEKGASRGILGAVGGAALGAYMIAEPAFSAEGGASERARAVTTGAGRYAGFMVGAKVGTGVGAAIGSYIPVVGTAIGAGVGFLAGGIIGDIAGGEFTDRLTRIPDRMVDRERKRRGLDWGQHRAAFQTKRAHTMRQQSLQLMNRGSMSARSLLGQEAMFVHK